MFLTTKSMSPKNFKRDVGISLKHFLEVHKKVDTTIAEEKERMPMSKRGIKSKMCSEDKLLLTFYYLKKYITFFDLGKMFSISESYAQKIYSKNSDILVKILHVDSRSVLESDAIEAIIIDACEQPIERPVKKQKKYYSGKKKAHTIKAQLIVCAVTLKILSVLCAKGTVHDMRILKESKLVIRNGIEKYLDSGYEGIHKFYGNCTIPFKKKKNKSLSKTEKDSNRKLAKKRIHVEHVNRRCKIFRIVKDKYRGKHKGYGKNWNIIAGLVNLRYNEFG
jgi:hypothetical protein